MDMEFPVCINNSTNIFNFQLCELGLEGLFSSGDNFAVGIKNSLESFLSLELSCYRTRALLRVPQAKISTCRRIVKCDIRVQELTDLGNCDNEDFEENQEIALSKCLTEVLKSRPGSEDVQTNFTEFAPQNSTKPDGQLNCVSGRDFKVLNKGIIKSMTITVICSSHLQVHRDCFFHDNDITKPDDSTLDKPCNIFYRKNLSNWKIVREKVRDIFQSYEIYAKSNTIVDLRSCSLSKFSSFVFPIVSYVFINDCSMNSNGTDIGRINSRTKINIKDIHHVDYFHRLYSKHIQASKFSSVLNSECKKLLTDTIGIRLKIAIQKEESKLQSLCTNFLISGPKSSGKKLLVKEVAKQLQANLLVFNVASESISNISHFSSSCQKIFDLAVSSGYFYPTILLLLRLDLLFTDTKSEVVVKSGQSITNKKKLINLICDFFDSIPKNSLLSVVAVTDSPYLIHPKLRRSGRLEREVNLKAPSLDKRLEILEVLVDDLPSMKKLDLKQIAEITPGYVGTDLRRLANLAVLKANEENCAEVLESHLRYAFSKVYPSVLQGSLGVVDIKNSISLEQIIGLDSVKVEMMKTIVWPIRYPSAFRTMGIAPAKGLLIFGPPGCAKTTLVRAVASSNQTNFLSVSAAELYTSGVGDSEKLIVDLYNRARMASPCIVFIDELELIVSARTMGKGTNSSNTSLLSMLLTEMDGIGNLTMPSEKSYNGLGGSMVITVAATNRPDLLDSALLRPGRFDRIIPVPPPDKPGRLALLKEITKNIPLLDVNLDQLATETKYFSGADLVNLCQEAALSALGEDLMVAFVTMKNFENAKAALGPSLTPEILQSFYKYAENLSGKLT